MDKSFVGRVLGLLGSLLFAHFVVGAAPLRAGQSPDARTSTAAPSMKEPARLPVYQVIKTGATASEAAMLAKKLGIRAERLRSEGGVLSFVDATHYLPVPSAGLSTSSSLDKAIAATRNKDASRKITPAILDTRATAGFHVLPESAALSKTVSAFAAAGLTPQFGVASVSHNELSFYSKDGRKRAVEKLPIDTEVTYRFTEPNGYPIYGPGAQAQITYDAASNVTRIFYAVRRLKVLTTVAVIPQAEANARIAGLLPHNSKVTSRLVYYAPPLGNDKNTKVAQLIPWYAYYGTTTVKNPRTGASVQVKSKIRFIPATKDPRFVPVAGLKASGGSHIEASVSVSGGRAPYRYLWSGSEPIGTRNTALSSIRYTPIVRTAASLMHDPRFRLERNAVVSVTVLDENGVSALSSETVSVHAHPDFPLGGRGESQPSYGSENPGDPLHWTAARIAWNKEMGTPGDGATLSFNWLGDAAWPGDFIRPTPAGTLVGTPWVYGDADFANWGVDTADIVLDNADGWTDGTVLMQPGAPAADYATASIATPVSAQTVSINGNGFGTPASYAVNYNASWGPIGPNDTLEWLLLDDCDMLDLLDGSNLNVAQRWGPSFGGLHVLTGFASLGYGDGPFEGGVADDVLGINGPAQTIVQSWFSSAAATGAGTAAAMGPALQIAPGIYACDIGDYFWGKGPVGPTIVPSDYSANQIAYWYLTATSSLQYLF